MLHHPPIATTEYPDRERGAILTLSAVPGIIATLLLNIKKKSLLIIIVNVPNLSKTVTNTDSNTLNTKILSQTNYMK